MKHKIVQSVWIGDKLSIAEQLCIRSFQQHGHDFHLYAYKDLQNVPENTILKDANEIISEDKIYRSDGGRLSSFANYFRWEMIKKLGGVYVDMDMVCLKPFDFEDDILYGHEADETVNTAVLGFPKGHFFARTMCKVCDDVNLFQPIDAPKTILKKVARKALFAKEKSRAKTRFSEPGGPYYVTKFLRYYDLIEHAKPINHFYSIPWQDWESIFIEGSGAEDIIDGAYGLHLWNNALQYTKGTAKDNPNKGSLFKQLCDQYL